MKQINDFITEKLILNKNINKNIKSYKYHPKTREELNEILENRLKEDKNANLNDIDVSEITDMDNLFYKFYPHNIDISEWDVSNVTNMEYMFWNCGYFNSDLSNWDVSKVKDMHYMFYNCLNFNSDLNNWNVSNTVDMNHMFYECKKLKNTPNWYKE